MWFVCHGRNKSPSWDVFSVMLTNVPEIEIKVKDLENINVKKLLFIGPNYLTTFFSDAIYSPTMQKY